MSVKHTENIIELKHVSFSYGEHEVLKDITFNIHRGDYLGMIGPNGSGKTTLLKIILGLLTPNQGSVHLFGRPSEQFKLRGRLGYVPQTTAQIDRQFPATVQEVVTMGRYGRVGLFHHLQKKDAAAIEQALHHVEMWDYRHRLIGDLSGGQQQRVFIARALAGEPEILILDEPTVGVDAEHQDQFLSFLHELNTKLQLTLILVSHDLDVVAKETSELACINQTLRYYGPSTSFKDTLFVEHMYGSQRKRIHHSHT